MTWTIEPTHYESEPWQQLLSTQPHLVFHEPAWANVLADGFGSEVICLLLKRDGQTLGGLAGFHYKAAWIRLTYFNLPYGGVIGECPPPDEFASTLHDWAIRSGVARIRIAASPQIPDAIGNHSQDSVEKAFKIRPLSTHILEFEQRDYETVWMSFKGRVRRDVRKADKSGVSVSTESDAAAVDAFYGLYQESMKRNETVAKYPRSFVKAIVTHLVSIDRGALLLAIHAGKPIAGMLLADSANGSHYLMAGSVSEGLQYCPNDMLLNHAVKRAIEKNYDYFDFLPSGENDVGLEQFKSKWDARKVSVPVYETIVQPGRMRLFDLAYRLAESRVGRRLVNAIRQRRGGRRA